MQPSFLLPQHLHDAIREAPFAKIAGLWQVVEEEFGEAGKSWLGRNDRYYLLVRLLHRHDCIHPWLYGRCREVEAEPDGYLDLWAREHYKSTIITYAGVIQEILKDPEITVGIFSHTKPTSKAFLKQIKMEFEKNELLKSLYSDVLYSNPEKDSPSWALDTGIIVKRASNPKEATVEAHGLVDGQPTSKHFKLMAYDDVVTDSSVNTPEQINKTTEAWELSDNLGAQGGRKWHIGTRYCTIGGTRILMADWSHKDIKDVQIGESVIGWELRDGKRWLKSVKVVDNGRHEAQPVNEYWFDNGRSVTCTPDHKWWRGSHGGGSEYAPLSLKGRKRRAKGVRAPNGYQSHICELLAPVEVDQSREAGWLAGFFDGEGTTKKNKDHPSGIVCLTQTMHNPDLVSECRRILAHLNFDWTESWHSPSKNEGTEHWSDRCVFQINGGWKERYRFLAQVNPTKRRFIEATLFGQLKTDKREVVLIEPQGFQDVYWLETETGNYVADGFCSKNSYADTYEEMIKRGAVIPRIYPATEDGTIDGKPVFFSQEVWDAKVIAQGDSTVSCQMLQNPLAGKQKMFEVQDLNTYEVRPETLNIYILVDPARSKKKDSNKTAVAVIGVDYALNKYLLDGFLHRMDLRERWVRTAQMWHKWRRAPGVQNCYCGYEAFGAQADLDYFLEQQRKPDEGGSFPILELMWPREGNDSKIDRVQRLGPDFRAHKFFLPYDTDEKNLTAMQRKFKQSGSDFRVAKPIKRKDENNNVYDLSAQFKMQVHFFPFGGQKDLIDAVSRIYDMEVTAPTYNEPTYIEPEWV